MTYCLGIQVESGLVCLADGRVTSGSQVRALRKLSFHQAGGAPFVIMTSGLRSLRDKTLAYLDQELAQLSEGAPESLIDAVSLYTRHLRRVAKEDREAVEGSKLSFNLHALIAGQLAEDRAPSIFMVYPEGNWVEMDRRTPYLAIGATTYGKPILDRALSYETDLPTAIKLAYLSFDSTRISSADVGFPIDIVTFDADERRWREAQFEHDDLRDQRVWWNEGLKRLATEMPDGPWLETLVSSGARPRLSVVPED